MPRYANLDGSVSPPFSRVFKWGVLDRVSGRRQRVTTPFATPRVDNDGAALRANVRDAAVCWLGHASFLVQLAGVNLLVDPIWSDSISGVVQRNVAPGVALDALPRVDAVLVTHNHRDHMDVPTLKALSACGRAVVPAGLERSFLRLGYRDVTALEWWQAVTLGPVEVTLVPAQHWSRRGLNDTNASLWGGYVIQGDGKRVYHSGDTAYFPGFTELARRLGSPDLALLPIGAYEPEWFMRHQHMNPEDALRAATDLDARRVLAMHWGTFQLSDEGLGEPPRRFLDAAERDPHLAARVAVVPVGGLVTF